MILSTDITLTYIGCGQNALGCCNMQIRATLWPSLLPTLNFAFFAKMTIEHKNRSKGMGPNFGQAPDFRKWTRLFIVS